MSLGRSLLLLLGLLGAFALWKWMPAYDLLAKQHVAVDRQTLIERTRRLGQEWGCPVRSNAPLVDTTFNRNFARWKAMRGGKDNNDLPQAFFRVVLPHAKDKLIAEYAATGRLTLYSCQSEHAASDATPSREAEARVFEALAGPEKSRFRPVAVSSGEKSRRFGWELASDTPSELTWTIATDFQGSRVRRAELAYSLNDAANQRLNLKSKAVSVISTAGNFINYVLFLFAPVMCIVAAVRKRLNVRFTCTLWVVAFLLSLPPVLTAENLAEISESVSLWVVMPAMLLGLLLSAALFAGMLGYGEIQARRYEHARWSTLKRFVAGRWVNRPVAWSVLGGLMASPAMACVSIVLVATQLAPDLLPGSGGRPRLPFHGARPLLFAMLPSFQDSSVTVFGLLLPWLGHRRRLLTVLGVVVALVAYAGDTSSTSGLLSVVLWAGLQLALAGLVYWQFGLLSTLIASLSADCLVSVVRLWDSAASPLHQAGGYGLALFGSVALICLVVANTGKAVDLVPESVAEAEQDQPVVSAREALRSEFSLAHRAQQQMLPSQPPALPGLDLAGLCHPARDVGGDLYDYVQLQDGRYGICVADVSGKGMPAALYMTFTKGLLTAAAQDTISLPEIAKHLNGHLYTAGRRKVFVTAAIGVVDPSTREFEYVRAGHNPIVWRKARSQETLLLQAPGMGLGVGSSRFFDRSLKSEQLQLQEGDALVFYSDGVTEAMNIHLEQYGEERLMHAVAQTDGLDAAATRDAVLSSVEQFLAGVHAQDDITIVVLRVLAL